MSINDMFKELELLFSRRPSKSKGNSSSTNSSLQGRQDVREISSTGNASSACSSLQGRQGVRVISPTGNTSSANSSLQGRQGVGVFYSTGIASSTNSSLQEREGVREVSSTGNVSSPNSNSSLQGRQGVGVISPTGKATSTNLSLQGRQSVHAISPTDSGDRLNRIKSLDNSKKQIRFKTGHTFTKARTQNNPRMSIKDNYSSSQSNSAAFSHRLKGQNNNFKSNTHNRKFNQRGSNVESSSQNQEFNSHMSDSVNRNVSQRPRRMLPTSKKFGYKRLEELANQKDSDEIILYLCQNYDLLGTFLQEKVRPDLLQLLLKIFVKSMSTNFKDSKLNVYTMICCKEFVDHLTLHVSYFLSGKMKNIDESLILLENLAVLIQELINVIPSKAVETLEGLINISEIVTKDLASKMNNDGFLTIYESFKNLKANLEVVRDRIEKLSKNEVLMLQKEQQKPPNDFRELSLYPLPEDLSHRNFLRENIVEGSYEDVYHYLDIQFRLLREDFIEPLREGIEVYRNSMLSVESNKKRNFYVRIYRNVKFTGMKYDAKKLGNLSFTVEMDKKIAGKIRWEYSKRLLFGSLCLFSRDNFETFQLATVSDRDPKELKSGIINVVLVGNNIFGNELFTSEFTMAESSAFFEPVFQVLKTIKQLPVDVLPMEKYLLVKDIQPSPPQYLLNVGEICIDDSIVDIHDVNTWPSSNKLGFNESQYAAFQAALRNDFSVIQGPPGTGKTYLGLKLVKTILLNFTLKSPILIVCYTNHALDQFLEGLLTVTKKIIRIGGQSKNVALCEFNYQNVRKKHRSFVPQCHELKSSMKLCLNVIASCNKLINGVHQKTGIIDILKYKDAVQLKHIDVFEDSADYLSWLLGDKYETLISIITRCPTNASKKPDVLSDSSSVNEEDEENAMRETYIKIFMDYDELELSEVKGEIHFALALVKLTNILNYFEDCLLKLKNERAPNHLKQSVIQNISTVNDIYQYIYTRLHDSNIKPSQNYNNLLNQNLWNLHERNRWVLYHFWINKIYEYSSERIVYHQNMYAEALSKFQENKVMEDYSILSQVQPQIIGLTTTGAARHHDLLSVLKPAIIVVEEAAEVLEAHIVVSLTKSCQQLILIGDHKQLKPNPSTYRLARKFKLDISLFERMIKNNVGFHTLNVQHRMKPNIATLIAPTIYPDLSNHDSVYMYPSVRGIVKNLYFVNHKVLEERDNDSESHSNPYEAEFMIQLCRYLLLQGYKPCDITILTTYSGQQFYLRELRKCMPLLKEVKITVVDNYQGEESNIILLSLVRNNTEGIIGFVGIENRICVALSRAKHGLYIMGNMELLKSNSLTWEQINTTLINQDAIGEHLSLVCQMHQEVTLVKCKNDFNKVIEGGCSLLCLRMMPCGHSCQSLCHVIDIEHKEIKCHQPCARDICDEPDHSCPLPCYKTCSPCEVMMKKLLPCSHEAIIPCSLVPADYKCKTIIKDIKPDCGHDIERYCFMDVNVIHCQTPCPIRLDCGHACSSTCHINNDPEHLESKCQKDCTKTNLMCKMSHPCQKRCFEECGKCAVKIKKQLSCGHTHNIDCSLDPDEFICKRGCKRFMNCGHKCKKLCYEECVGCKIKVEKIIEPCGHKIKVECDLPVTPSMCKSSCKRLLKCGHKCKLKCSQDCEQQKCNEYVPSPVTPACGHVGEVLCYKSTEYIDPTSDSLLKNCQGPCNKELPCKDICVGTCGSCMQGRIHQVCNSKCGNTLICGHECSVPCRDECPPCRKKCSYKCKHSECGKNCGVPCVQCTEKCDWNCKHLKCTKLCGEECDREPCYEACDEKLKCGHPCVGFCGEQCPPLCRICNRDELTECFFGTEDEEDARFVYLLDCKHIFESSGLDHWMKIEPTDGKSHEIRIKGCPKCKTTITLTPRYSNAVKKAFKQIEAVKRKIFGQEKEIQALQNSLISVDLPKLQNLVDSSPDFVRMNSNLKAVLNILKNINQVRYTKRMKPLPLKFSSKELQLFSFHCKYLELLLKFYNSFQIIGECPTNTVMSSFKLKIDGRFDLLLYHLSKRKNKLGLNEMKQANSELNRFIQMVEFYEVLMGAGSRTVSAHSKAANEIISKLFSIKPYDCSDGIKNDIKKFTTIGKVFYQLVTKNDFDQVCKAMEKSFTSPSKQGHWFQCSNGHIYVITECGGAMETSLCPECKEVIGGKNHSLVGSSRLATRVDGAKYAAWSENQNMQNFGF